MSGSVKLQSGCPTWWGLTALQYHWASQCIPTPLAWWANLLPVWAQKWGVASTFIIQIPGSLLLLCPSVGARAVAVVAQVFLQLLIMLTGNYNFFNINTIVLCLALLPDQLLLPSRIRLSLFSRRFQLGAIVAFGVLMASSKLMVNVGIVPSLAFDRAQLNSSLDMYLKYVPPYVLLLAVAIGLASLYCETGLEKGSFHRLISTSYAAVAPLMAILVIAGSLAPLQQLAGHALDYVPHGLTSSSSGLLNHWGGGHGYGLFRSMTGVGSDGSVAVPVVVLEGSHNMQDWVELFFPYYSGNVTTAPPVIAPHQPRLDWQVRNPSLSVLRLTMVCRCGLPR